jgi:DNA polymerase-1
MEQPKKLFLLDAFALIYRGYFALNANPGYKPVNSRGVDTSAILGFVNTMVELIAKENPTHIAVIFDTPEPTIRHIEYKEYKANRDEVPNAITVGVPYIEKIIDAFNIKRIGIPGYEADDVIGTLAKQAAKQGVHVYMMTPDKDFGQLVGENIWMYKPGRQGNDSEIWGPAEVCAKFDLHTTEQVIDMLGLMGDTVDNIPGVPGIGPKTASKLLKEFGSLENILANTDKQKGKLKENLETYREQAVLSKRLATILLDAPIEFHFEDFSHKEKNTDELHNLFSELEFRSLSKRILSKEIMAQTIKPAAIDGENTQPDLFSDFGEEVETVKTVTNFKTIEDTPHTYYLVNDKAAMEKLAADMNAQTEFCFDTETTGLDVLTCEIVGLSVSFKEGEAWYVPFPASQEEAKKQFELFKPVFENDKIIKIGQNIKYDIGVLKNYDVPVKGTLFDTMLVHYILKPESKHGMDIMSENYLQYRPVSIETLIGKKGKSQMSMRDVEIEKIKDYAAEDADVTLKLKNYLQPILDRTPSKKVYTDIEGPLVSVLERMEREGIRVDKPFLEKFSAEIFERILKVEDEIQELAGKPLFEDGKGKLVKWNVDSPRQVGEVLFERLKLDDKAKKTAKTKQYSTDESNLQKYEKKHPIISKILDYRELAKLKSTYADAIPLLINPKTGRVHTSFMQAVAATGRLSSDKPNLQNIPIRTELGKQMRKAFIARDENHVLISADYSQIELRVIAALSGDKNMIEAFKSGQDFHTATAAKVYNVSPQDVTKEMRSAAKAVNFGIIYGQSAFGLAQSLGIGNSEAKEIIENYFAQYPGIKEYMVSNIMKARKQGFVETVYGRRRYLPDIESGNAVVRGFSERNAINSPIQGSAADMIKLAMIKIDKALINAKYKTKMILQVHDELIFDAPKEEVTQVSMLIKNCMEAAMQLDVPIVAEVSHGANWLEAH